MTLWLSNLAAYSVQLAVLAGTAAVVTSWLRLRQPRAALAFWQALLVVSLLLPMVQPWSGTSPDFITSTLAFTTSTTVASTGAGDGISVATWLAITFATGVVIRLAWLGLGLIRLRQITANAERSGAVSTDFFELTS